MSEGVPKRKVGDEIQVMNTDRMQELKFANKRGTVLDVIADDYYFIECSDGDFIAVFGHSLRAWVEPLKGDLK